MVVNFRVDRPTDGSIMTMVVGIGGDGSVVIIMKGVGVRCHGFA